MAKPSPRARPQYVSLMVGTWSVVLMTGTRQKMMETKLRKAANIMMRPRFLSPKASPRRPRKAHASLSSTSRRQQSILQHGGPSP